MGVVIDISMVVKVDFDVIIGIEVHAQLKTKTKLFCGCSTKFGQTPNRNTCPICLGLPGVLPVINKKAVEFVIKTGIVLNCEIANFSIFARKNYYYPDLPKNYQISQYENPLCKNGECEIKNNNLKKKIRIKRVHLEEDAAKLIHILGSKSAIDYNRTGIPLMEIVTEPDINSPDEAYEYLVKLRDILVYLDTCDGNMEEGSFRCEPNISLRKKGDIELGVKTELKNLNSFKAVRLGLEYEIKRQTEILKIGERVMQETRRWDDEKEITYPMRSKEEAHDYRYFPEPDLVPIIIDKEWVCEIKNTLPELPDEKRERFIRDFNLPEYDAQVLTSSKYLADYFEKICKIYPSHKIVSNWIMSELLKLLNLEKLDILECKITTDNFSNMLKMIDKGIISGKIAKTVFEEMFYTGKEPELIVKEKELLQITDEDELLKTIDEVLKENKKVVDEYKSVKERAFGFLVGQVMKKTSGLANPQIVNKFLKDKLSN